MCTNGTSGKQNYLKLLGEIKRSNKQGEGHIFFLLVEVEVFRSRKTTISRGNLTLQLLGGETISLEDED